jgi:hypothetical protein
MNTPLARLSHRLGCALALAVGLTLLLSTGASADLTFGSLGSGAGQTDEPEGVAVDRTTQRLYVADRNNNRIDVFKADGSFAMAFGWGVADGTTKALQSCTTTCFKGLAGSGAGQMDSPAQIAVDNSGGPSQGDVYVGTDNFRVQKFGPGGEFKLAFGTQGKGKCQLSRTDDPIAVGPGGIVYVADSARVGPAESEGFIDRIQKFEASGACLEEVALFNGKRPFPNLAVDSSGDVYVADDSGLHGIQKFHPNGLEYGAPYPLDNANFTTALAVDGADNLFAAQGESAPGRTFWVIAEYDSAGNTLRRFGYDAVEHPLRGIAVLPSAAGDVFASEVEVGIRYLAFPPPGPIAPPSTVKATVVGNTKATLNAQVNPEGKASTYHFDYVDQKGFEESGFSASKSTPQSASIGSDFHLHAAKAEIGCPKPEEPPQASCLTPDTTYHFRIAVKDAEGNEGEVQSTFKTQPPLRIEATYATEVGTDTATLHAEVNPLGIPATGHFQYVDEAAYEADVQAQGEGHGFDHASNAPSAGQLDFGEGEAPLIRGATIFPLTPGTTYRYRLIAEDPFVTVVGPERTLTTFAPLGAEEEDPCANEALRGGPAAFLPDCRGYEMVSPLEKNNGDVLPPIEAFTELPAALNQSSPSGEKLTYSSARTFGDALSAPLSAQYVAARDPEAGWQTHAIVPPRSAPVLTPGKQLDTEFKAFSPDLCDAWLRTTAEPVLAEGAIPRFPNLYHRRDDECGGPSFEALTTVPPQFETTESPYAGQHYASLELQGLSADGAKAIYVVTDNLTEDAPPQSPSCLEDLISGSDCRLRLYVQSASDPDPHFVCILPSGAPAPACTAGLPADNTGTMRESRIENAMSADGSRVFWTSFIGVPGRGKIYLRENPAAPPSELVGGECIEAEKACTIAVSKDAEALSGANSSEYWAAARDGSKAIFTSGQNLNTGEDLYEFAVDTKTTHLIAHKVVGVLGASEDASYVYFASTKDLGGGAIGGEPNLYLYHGGTFSFVATLANADLPNISEESPLAVEPRRQLARVSPDGRHAAFMSFGQPTGYDNHDATNGKAAGEVYLYDAAANEGQGKLICPSCNPSGTRPIGSNFAFKSGREYWAAAHIPLALNSLYASRALADDGRRLYFASADALSPRDTNGAQDVYQWEQGGAGGCEEGDTSFAPASGGCLTLISSGKSSLDSEFVDASPNGHDVFFSTLSALVSQDYGLVDIYDARVGGGFPEPPNSPAPCEGEACQSPPEAPNDPTPASSAFQGAGNVVEGKPASCRKPKVRRRGRCVPRKHHKRAHGHKRASHKGRAGL